MLLTFPSNFSFLKILIAENELTGSIPTEVGLLTDLITLYLSKYFISISYHALKQNRFVRWF